MAEILIQKAIEDAKPEYMNIRRNGILKINTLSCNTGFLRIE